MSPTLLHLLKKIFFAYLSIWVLCVSDMFGGVIDENAFTAPIHVELSQAPPPLWQPAQPAGAQHLALGRLLAKAGKTNEALAEYAKAVDSDNAPTRASAMAGSEELLTWQSRLQDWIQDRLALIWIAGFNIVIAIVLFFLAERLASCIGYLVRISRRKNSPPRLEIEPLSYWPSTEKPYTHFREIANFVRERMSKQYLLKQKIKISQEATVLPTIVLETSLRAWEAPLSLVSEKAWPIFIVLLRKINPVDYTLEGSLSLQNNYHVILRLLKRERTAQTWECSFAQGNLTNGLKDLAHAVLTWIVGESQK